MSNQTKKSQISALFLQTISAKTTDGMSKGVEKIISEIYSISQRKLNTSNVITEVLNSFFELVKSIGKEPSKEDRQRIEKAEQSIWDLIDSSSNS